MIKNEYDIPVCRALTKYPTISDIPRGAFIGIVLSAGLFIFVYQAYWSVALFLPLFFIIKKISKKDPLFLKILFKYLKEKKYFYGG